MQQRAVGRFQILDKIDLPFLIDTQMPPADFRVRELEKALIIGVFTAGSTQYQFIRNLAADAGIGTLTYDELSHGQGVPPPGK